MKNRDDPRTTAVGEANLTLRSEAHAEPETTEARPNIVLIMADDLGYETLGCYGARDYRTPHLDALADRGVRFNHCYAQPLCTPSRAQIMTGRYNHRNYEGFGYLNPKETTFANLLKRAGYQTCIAGKWQLCGDADTVRHFGFDEHCLWNMHPYREDVPDAKEPERWIQRYDAPTLYVNGKWTEHQKGVYGPQVCTDFICSFIQRNKDQPFLVYYPMILTHSPFCPTPNSRDKRCEDDKQNFMDMVEYTDLLVGRIVRSLEELGILDNTLVLFTGDNGTAGKITSATTTGYVRGGKSKMTDAGTRVPLIASWPAKAPQGSVLDDLVDFSDFLPTLCQAGGCPVPSDRIIDGRSFLPQVRGEHGVPREWIFCHYWENGRKKEGAREFVRDRRWKLYDNGDMYDIEKDVLEQSPVPKTEPEAAFDLARRGQ